MQTHGRLALVDVARGGALIAMLAYHFAWDLGHFRLATWDLAVGPVGIVFARTIAASFLALVGVSLVLAHGSGVRIRTYLHRLALVAGAAAAITGGTWILFPQSLIFFGILHCIALSSLLALPFLRLPTASVLAAAAFCIAAPTWLRGPLFDAPWLIWLGLSTLPPQSNDFVPLFPWFGIVLLGLAGARTALARWGSADWTRWRPPGAAGRALAWGGRHSLFIYLVHQPVLFAMLWGVVQVVGPSRAAESALFRQSCGAQCEEAGGEPEFCRALCLCAMHRIEAEGLWSGLLANSLTEQDQARVMAIARACRE